MTWRRATRFIGIVAVIAVVSGCARPNADGWWDKDAHAVDGYWVTHERPCEPDGEDECEAAIEAAIAILRTTEPDAVITKAGVASYPVQGGRTPNEITINIGGLVEPRFAILDLADGSRRAFGMSCGPDMSEGERLRVKCWESEFEVWRVTGS